MRRAWNPDFLSSQLTLGVAPVITPKSLRWHRARQKAGNGPCNATSRQVRCVHSLTAWNVASKCGCKSALVGISNLSICRSHPRPVRILLTHLDAILPSGRDHLAAVKLKRRHAMVIFDRLEDSSRAQVPNLSSFFLLLNTFFLTRKKAQVDVPVWICLNFH